ncbi:hypothetical protein [Psychroserpens algicola]|uniref:YD repeat-containing protein n=1 Tax=Psychroserpens algicola TaxID=1719034 RepID=A0ABT0HAS8_9FLAO|nr:hypothetical protein [Psychroserpens algicola]MCK8481471.1 hypothetical protein [Psychroserpens algicola]
MKISLVLLLCMSLSIYAQDIPDGTTYIKTIQSTVYKKKDTLNHRTLKTYYDNDWNVLTNSNNLSAALDKGSETVTIMDTDKKFVSAIITSKKDTLDYIVYLYDDAGNRTNYYQIRKGDTLNDQKRTYDKNGNNLELFNKKNGKYYLSFEAEYNDDNKVIHRNWYNANKALVKIEQFEYINDGKTKLYYKTDKKGKLNLVTETTEIDPETLKKTYHIPASGINYGIKLEHKKGYYSITKTDEKERFKSLEIFDKKGRLTTSVYVTYETL